MDDILRHKESFNTDIKAAVVALKKGDVILYPTDTVWGIGCDATNADAVEKVYEIKSRDYSKSMIVLVDSLAMLDRVVEDIPEVAEELISVSDEPLTIIYDKARGVAANIPAKDGSIAVRITHETYSRELCRRLGRPIVSTSANISGAKTPQNFREISQEIIDQVDYVATSRRDDNTKRKPSSIIKISQDGIFKIFR